MIHAGDRITVHGEKSFAEDATAVMLCHPDELPAIEGAPNVESVRAIIAEKCFVTVALIEYKFLDQTLAFVAFEDTKGRWFDLKGQRLIIEPRPAENAARREPGTRIVSRRPGIDWRRY